MISVALETLETLIAIVVPPMLKGKETGTPTTASRDDDGSGPIQSHPYDISSSDTE